MGWYQRRVHGAQEKKLKSVQVVGSVGLQI